MENKYSVEGSIRILKNDTEQVLCSLQKDRKCAIDELAQAIVKVNAAGRAIEEDVEKIAVNKISEIDNKLDIQTKIFNYCNKVLENEEYSENLHTKLNDIMEKFDYIVEQSSLIGFEEDLIKRLENDDKILAMITDFTKKEVGQKNISVYEELISEIRTYILSIFEVHITTASRKTISGIAEKIVGKLVDDNQAV